jgi:hypothetical protein
MRSRPVLIDDTNLSRAWVRAVATGSARGVESLTPLVVTDGQLPLVPAVTAQIEGALRAKGLPSSHTTANTIFPSGWNRARPRAELFERYKRMLPRIHRHTANRYGVYFERLVAFGPDKRNQLEYIISTYEGKNHRNSALQATILDPERDQTNQPVRGFPCLQQVSFTSEHHNSITVTGYYATQYLMTRGYGNYIGLCRLGQFVAHELGQPCVRMTCIAAVAQLGDDWSLKSVRADLVQWRAALAAADVPLPDEAGAGGAAA